MLKKMFVFIMMISVGFLFVSCDLFGTLTTTSDLVSSSETSTTTINSSSEISTTMFETTTVSSTVTDTTTLTTQIPTTTTQTTTQTTTTEEITTTLPTTTEVTTETGWFYPSGYSLLQDELDYVGIPSQGDVDILVFAVDFSDYPSYLSDVGISDIELAFNGGSDDLVYESLSSYYSKSSYGALNINADVYGYYRASQPASYYEEEYYKLWATDPFTGDWLYGEDEVTYADSDLIYEVLSFYDNQIDYSNYDSNQDGFIDGIYIIYTYPVSYDGDSDLWWAYQDFYAYEGDLFDGVEPLYYVWSGDDFLTEGSEPLNARTIIHETGHMLGLDDYYDYYPYDNDNEGGLGGADMMDSAFGDHNAFSKILLGWVTPMVVEGSATIDLLPFIESGEVILVTSNWKNSIFDEYFLISYYTPTGLNLQDKYELFTLPGILIYHVSAAIDDGYNEEYEYYSIFNNNNTDSPNKLIDIVEADMNEAIERYSRAENTDLFQPGDSFGGNIYPTYRWDNRAYIGFDVVIVSTNNESYRIQIRY